MMVPGAKGQFRSLGARSAEKSVYYQGQKAMEWRPSFKTDYI